MNPNKLGYWGDKPSWNDASRGNPQPGHMYASVITPVNMNDPVELARWQQKYGGIGAQPTSSPVQSPLKRLAPRPRVLPRPSPFSNPSQRYPQPTSPPLRTAMNMLQQRSQPNYGVDPRIMEI